MNNKIRIFLTTIRDARAEQLTIAERALKAAQDLQDKNADSPSDVDKANNDYLEAKIALAMAEMELVKAL